MGLKMNNASRILDSMYKHLFRSMALLLLVASCFQWGTVSAQPATDSLYKDLEWRNIGPSNMMGRIAAIDALNDDYKTVLIGTASGGVWKSTNAGNTFTSIFDDYGSQSIGDVAFFQDNPDIIWVGTGEAANRNSVGWGDGIYKSTDGGETFEKMGLGDTFQISEIAPHPTNPNIVYVAALGDLWSYQGRRGIFKTTDGGETWQKLTNGLPGDGKTGGTVVELNPENPDEIYAGMYQRLRSPWDMKSGGPNGGIYKSTDGGESWKELTNGLPKGDTGQIDVDVYRSNPETVVAYVEASDNLPHDTSVPGPGAYRSDDGGESWEYLYRHNSRPYYHGRIRINPSDDDLIYIVARHFYYSEDGGDTFEAGKPFSSGGGDDHDLWISPQDKDVMYTATDQGAHLTLGNDAHISFTNMPIGQYYEVGYDMRDPYWVYGGLQDNGGWGIASQTRNRNGIRMDHAVKINGGDGFHMMADPTNWKTVYTAAHVGVFARKNMKTREATLITPTPQTTINFEEYYDPDFDEGITEYTINPGEHWFGTETPSRTINGNHFPPQFRWNWNSPISISNKNPRTIYVGSNHLFKSVDRGDSWKIISPDLTTNNPETRNSTYSGGLTRDATGAENHNTIYSVEDSPLDSDIIWVGTDDGNVQVTQNGGESWTEVSDNIPGYPDTAWVSQVKPSNFNEGTAYVTVDNHRIGDFTPYVYKTTDFGETWTDISDGIPDGVRGNSVHTIVEDYVNPNLLFVGTEFGAFVSIDGGDNWSPLMNNLPPVAVRDLEIHPREADLIAGTHGRSVWILDDITPLQQLSQEIRDKQLHLFESQVGTKWQDRTNYSLRTELKFNGKNPPRASVIDFYLRDTPDSGEAEIRITDVKGEKERLMNVDAAEGINRAHWDFQFLPSEEEKASARDRLSSVLGDVRQALEKSQNEDMLLVLAKDLLAEHRAPDPFEDLSYPPMKQSREVLQTHVKGIAEALDEASSYRDLNDIREELMRFTPILGDKSYFDNYFGKTLTTHEAEAGTYHVEVEAGGQTVNGTIEVREDPKY